MRLCQAQEDNVDAWLYLAGIDEQVGLYPDAERYALRALALDPDEPETHFLISRTRWARGIVKEAVMAAESATELDPAHHAAWLHLGNMKRAIGETRNAEKAFRRALELAPADNAARIALAQVLLLLGKPDDAVELCTGVQAPDPAWPQAQLILGRALWQQGDHAAARAHWRTITPEQSAYGHAQALLGAKDVSGTNALQRRQRYYDECAHAYSYLTTEVADYRLPARLARELRRMFPGRERCLTVLDAGCGAGACGPVLRSLAFTLTGVDISPLLLDQAGQRGAYDTLIQQDAIALLHDNPSSFDLIVATDVFETCEEIDAALGAALAALRPGGVFVLSPSARSVTRDGFDPTARGLSLAKVKKILAGTPWRTDTAGRALAYRYKDRSIHSAFLILRTAGALSCRKNHQQPPRKSGADKIYAAQGEQGNNNLAAAQRQFRQALRINPGSADARFGIGFVRQSRGQFNAAQRYYQRALDIDPTHFGAWFQLGTIAQHLRRPQRAAECYQKAIAFEPKLAVAYHNLSILRDQQGKPHEAAWLRARAAMEDRGFANLYQQQPEPPSPFAEAEPETAVAPGETEAIVSDENGPDDAVLRRVNYLLGRGVNLRQQGSHKQAIEVLTEAVELKPDDVTGHMQLGFTLQEAGRLDEALAFFGRAAALSETPWEVWQSIAGAHAAGFDMSEAYRWYQKAADSAPPDSPVHGNRLFMLNYQYTPAASVAEKHLDWGRRYEATITPIIDAAFTNPRSTRRKLRIGYLSADFFGHSVSWFLESLLAWHDHDEFEFYCYANVENYDAVTMRMRYYADYWRRIRHLDDLQAAQQIRADEIDILVDLSGHTGGCRPGVLARRGAPVQATYLGYANTTGLSRVDYRITDADADPVGMTDAYHSERLYRLPRCFLCYRPFDSGPPVRWPPAGATHATTFACFNNLYKVNDHVIDVWSRILREIPDAILVIKSQSFRIEDARRRIIDKFAQHGVRPSQLRLPDKLTYSEHLDLYANMDVLLDPFPYNGTTTTCETLWMGSPVITLAGDRHSSRVGVSILKTVGLEELIASDDDDYVSKTVELAQDRQRLGEYRKSMRERLRGSPLLDGQDLARAMESAYREMWANWCAQNY